MEELNNLLNKRIKYLKRNKSIKNIKIKNNIIFFDTDICKDIEDCRFDENFFYVVGNEGEGKVLLDDDCLKNIKIEARNMKCGGLK